MEMITIPSVAQSCWEFTVPGIPIAQPRQKTRKTETRDGREFLQNYTPTGHPVNAYKAVVKLCAASAYAGSPLDCPIRLTLTFVLPRPKNLFWKTKPMPREWHTGRPDSDNLAKSTKDALKGVVWRDDSLVAELHVVKQIASGDEQPHAVVKVELLQ